MEIGPLLKSYRKSLKRTQRQFAQGVLSHSFLSKVEQGNHRISAKDLFLLLAKNQISQVDFFKKLNLLEETTQNDVIEKIYKAYYARDLKYLESLKLNGADHQKSSLETPQLLATVLVAILKEEQQQLPEYVIQSLKNQVFDQDYLDHRSLSILVNIVDVYENQTLVYFVQKALEKYNLTASSLAIQKILYSLLLNVSRKFLLEDQPQKCEGYLRQLRKVPVVPELVFQRVVLNLYQAIWDYQQTPNPQSESQVVQKIAEIEQLAIPIVSGQIRDFFTKIKRQINEQ